MALKKVIDVDSMICLEKYEEENVNQVAAKYEAMGIYNDVSIDSDNDIIVANDDF